MLDRIIKNWKTTMAGLIPAIVAVGTIFGFDIDPAVVMSIVGGVYVIIFLLLKDQPKE